MLPRKSCTMANIAMYTTHTESFYHPTSSYYTCTSKQASPTTNLPSCPSLTLHSSSTPHAGPSIFPIQPKLLNYPIYISPPATPTSLRPQPPPTLNA